MHAWNRAFADTSLFLLIVTMAMGPLSKLVKPVKKFLPWRKEFGIWAAITALEHIYIVVDGWVRWNFILLFKVPFYNELVLHPGFALENLIGIADVGYLLLLAFISNQRSVVLLGGSAWNYLQQKSHVLDVLVVLHTVYFIFFHMPDRPNWLQQPLIIAVSVLLVLRWMVFISEVKSNKK